MDKYTGFNQNDRIGLEHMHDTICSLRALKDSVCARQTMAGIRYTRPCCVSVQYLTWMLHGYTFIDTLRYKYGDVCGTTVLRTAAEVEEYYLDRIDNLLSTAEVALQNISDVRISWLATNAWAMKSTCDARNGKCLQYRCTSCHPDTLTTLRSMTQRSYASLRADIQCSAALPFV